MTNEYNLNRFVEAQDGIIQTVQDELRAGSKHTHWMWFVFPQFKGLGVSDTSRKYAIRSRGEAVAYSSHPVLGSRLRECTRIVIGLNDLTAEDVFGDPDHLKFRSCMTLFHACAADNALFEAALGLYFASAPDERTLELLGQEGESS